MNTPIADFVTNYIKQDFSRFHMPGHKGKSFLGFEKFDITEISGADVLSTADGIIGESEDNASMLFGTRHSFYITQGSAAAICAMLALIKNNQKQYILAARNVHKAFIHACALLDFDVEWLINDNYSHIIKCEISPQNIEKKLTDSEIKPAAVYLTSPDYLGNMQNIEGISAVCKKYSVPLLVDNAHGAYLKFTKNQLHPIDLGADVCCDSAHKTLPVLTGGAYLHVSKNAPDSFYKNARSKISLFSSTSPSYLVLQSLDICNAYLSKTYKNELESCIKNINSIKNFLVKKGFFISDSEPLKLVIDAAESGYTGMQLAELIRKNKLEPEFYDKDFLVLMITPQNDEKDFSKLKYTFEKLTPKMPIKKKMYKIPSPSAKMSIRKAVFAPCETIKTENSAGRICASPTVSCPPAVPIAVSGEIITKEMIQILKHYGIDEIQVVR